MPIIREAHWNCPHCGTAGVPGRDASCPTCARPRSDDVPLYVAVEPGSAAGPATPSAAGPPSPTAEWTCPYCADRNRPADLACRGCGAPRTDRVAIVPAAPAHPRPVAVPRSAPPADAEQGAGAYRLWMGICGVLLLCMAVGLGVSMASEAPVGGEDLIPAVVASKKAFRTVDVERRDAGLWATIRNVDATAADRVPAWPAVKLRRGERLGGRFESYTVTYRRESGLEHMLHVDRGAWEAIPVGGRAALRVTYGDTTEVQVLPADSLATCRRWHLHPSATPPDSLGCSPAAP